MKGEKFPSRKKFVAELQQRGRDRISKLVQQIAGVEITEWCVKGYLGKKL